MMAGNPRKRVLILFAHPAFQKSRVNRVLAGRVRYLESVTFHDLYEAYPDMDIDVKREQDLLRRHDIIVFQHPFFWYSTPAILKEWQDLVLQHGWAYGHEGKALRGKVLLNAITTGAEASAYRRGGPGRFTMRELLAPIEQTANLCGMDYLPPFVVHGTHQMDEGAIEGHAGAYRRAVLALRDNRVVLEAVRKEARLNVDLDAVTQEGEDEHVR